MRLNETGSGIARVNSRGGGDEKANDTIVPWLAKGKLRFLVSQKLNFSRLGGGHPLATLLET